MPFRTPGGIATPRSSNAGDAPGAIRVMAADASGDYGVQMRMYFPTGTALVVGQALMVKYTGHPSTNPQVAVTASGTATFDRLAVAVNATASGNWDWFWIEGYAQILVEGTTDVAQDDFLKSVTGTSSTGLIKDGSTRSANSLAIACAAQTANSAVLTLCYILGDQGTFI